MSRKFNKPYEEYVEMFKKLCDELGKTLTGRDLRSKDIDLPSDIWFIKNCPNEDIKTYNDFLSWLGYKANKPYRKYNYEIAFEEFSKRDLILLPQEYKNCAEKMKFICSKHPNIIQEKSLNCLLFAIKEYSCRYCFLENDYGENSHSWKGGVSALNAYLREFINEWKKLSMKSCNYKCVITGDKFDDIHHLYSFNKILKEVMDECNLPIYTEINKYTKEQLELIKLKNIELHNKYPLGICLCKSIHNLYHHIYGDNNTPEQFEEFRIRYNNGEFIEGEQLKNIKQPGKAERNIKQKLKLNSVTGESRVRNNKEITEFKQKKIRKKHILSTETKKRISESKIKFNLEQVLEIRDKYSSGKYKQDELAKEYSTVISVISNIINYKGVYKNYF